MKITFLGATGTVTGSKYLVEHNGYKVLLDCGLFQGYKELRLRNWAPLPVDPASLDAVVLTHAHLDHSGYVPLLVRNGFKGPVYCSPATKDLCALLLPDSAHIQEEDAERANRYHYSKHNPAMPLYTVDDAFNAMESFKTVAYGKAHPLGDDLTFTLTRAGHILGSSFVTFHADNKKLVFSGDIGRPHDEVMKPPSHIEEADYLVLESTYGDRLHERSHPGDLLGEVIRKTAGQGGKVVIPAFAVGRAQAMLYYVHALKAAGKIPNIPVFLDSPMAINATRLFGKYPHEHRMTEQAWAEVTKVAAYTRTVQESKQIDALSGPAIIISASGMATGGRVLHHLKAFIGNHRNTILFTGYQAGGTRGDRLLRGEREVKIHGQMYPVRATVKELRNLSAHGDYEEIIGWLGHFKKAPTRIFITHGEPEGAAGLKAHIGEALGWENCTIPEYLQEEAL